MNDHYSGSRATAEDKFSRKQRKAEEAVVAMSDYEKATQHRIANTARLRALRLARDAELAKPVKPTSPRPAKAHITNKGNMGKGGSHG